MNKQTIRNADNITNSNAASAAAKAGSATQANAHAGAVRHVARTARSAHTARSGQAGRLVVVDVVAYMLLALSIGIATSIALGSAVLLLASEATPDNSFVPAISGTLSDTPFTTPSSARGG